MSGMIPSGVYLEVDPLGDSAAKADDDVVIVEGPAAFSGSSENFYEVWSLQNLQLLKFQGFGFEI